MYRSLHEIKSTSAKLKMRRRTHSSAPACWSGQSGRHEGRERPRGRHKCQVQRLLPATMRNSALHKGAVPPPNMKSRDLCRCLSVSLHDAASPPVVSWLLAGAAGSSRRRSRNHVRPLPLRSAQSPPRPRPRLSLCSSYTHPPYHHQLTCDHRPYTRLCPVACLQEPHAVRPA